VLLVDRLKHLGQAAFSSAALPLKALERFGLSADVGRRLRNADQHHAAAGVCTLVRDPEQHRLWADRLSFFLGSDRVRQGYGWVFAMAPCQLKVGYAAWWIPAAPS
jgi:flavin-dependent dehydrogenase